MSISLSTIDAAMKIIEDVAMTRINGLKEVVVEKELMIGRMDREITAKDAEIKALLARIATLENGEAISIQYIRTLEGVNKERHERIAYLEEATASKGEHKFISFEEWQREFRITQ